MKNNLGSDIRDAFFEEILSLAKKDKDLLFITDDLDALILKEFKKSLPKQYINIGVAEQALVDVAAGLASCGKKVFIYGINSYITARCYEQLRFSVCSMNLSLVIVGVGSGFSFSFDGSSHHGTSDVAIMRILPEVQIFNPCDELTSRRSAVLSYRSKTPIYVRLDKGSFPQVYLRSDSLSDGFKVIKKGSNVVITTGFMTQKVYGILDEIKKERELSIGMVDVFRIKPLSKNLLSQVLLKSRKVMTIEENFKTGGLGSAISEIISDEGLSVKLRRLSVENRQFSVFGDRDFLLKLNKLDDYSIEKSIVNFFDDN